MAKKFVVSFVALVLCLIYSSQAFGQGQGSTRGNLGGTVLDASKAVVPDASVTITGPLGSQTQATTSEGKFLFKDLVPGNYSAKVEKQGFNVSTIPSVEVLINNTTTVSVMLQTGSISTSIEVTASAVSVDPTSSSINTSLSDTFYNDIPVQRNVSSLMMLAPGVVSGLGTSGGVAGSAASDANPSISGASGLENLYVADGVILNDPSYGGLGGFSTVYGALGVGITPSFVKEEEVKTAGFEPKYGHATGGVVQIVTKSGSTQFHGTIGGYAGTPGMQDTFANHDDFGPANLWGRHLSNGTYEGDFQLGGYVPFLGLKNHLFFFGAFNPIFFKDYEAPALGSGLYTLYNGKVNRQTDTLAYAAKLTYKINDSVTAESSVFGDPSHTNKAPWYSVINADNTSVNSKWNMGTRNWATRLDATITPTWTADFAFTYNWNHFVETPADNTLYPIADNTQIDNLPGQRGAFTAQGLATGILVNYQAHSETLSFDTNKVFKFAGSHTLSAGYFWQNPTYDDVTRYSGPSYVIPATNATGGDPGTALAAGKLSDASFELLLAPATCTLCPLMDVPGYASPQPVMLWQVRGRFDGGLSHNTGRYHAAYVNDSWQMSPHVTLNVGLRWEQQRLVGTTGAHMLFNDQWSPRIGFIVSPNPNSKIYVDFDRLAFVLPLDLAVREISHEADDLNSYWAPASSGGMVTLDKYGTVNFVGDAAHLLNNAAGGIDGAVNINIQSSTGEPVVPRTRFEYNDEFVVGAEHKFGGGFFLSARYVDRRMKRVVEDMVGQSVEQLYALAVHGGSYSYVLGNPSTKLANFVTPNEQTFGAVASKAAFYAAVNTAIATPSAANAAVLTAMGYPAACIDSNYVPTVYNAPNMKNTFGTIIGSACFPAVNGVGNNDPTALFGGEFFPNGCAYCKPGLYPDVARNYQAVEIEVNKSFSNNWQLRSNLRVGRLVGNYEGAFRNDNGQSDPGISSLFDLTDGELGLLGSQLGLGSLNTDRRYILNIEPSYTVANGFAKKLVLGTAVNVLSGIPLTTLAAQQIYGNPGEVPIHGRGDLGRSPVTGTVSAHLEYPIRLGEGKVLELQMDAFNIANTKRSITSTQWVDLGFGLPNVDYTNHIPLSFVPPFSARFALLFKF